MSIIGITVFSCLAAYVFARLKFFGKEVLFFLVVFLRPSPMLAVFTFGMRYYIEGLTSGAIKS